MKTILSPAPTAGLTFVAPVQSVTPFASWQGELALVGSNGTPGFGCDGHVVSGLHSVSGVVAGLPSAALPYAAMPFAASTLAATAAVQAVAGTQQVATAPKQAEKPNDTRNDVIPLGTRPGAPPS